MISLVESLIVLTAATVLIGFAVFKSPRVRIVVSCLMLTAIVRALLNAVIARS